MARTLGAIDYLRRQFEEDFFRYCEEHDFSEGRAFGILLHEAFEKRHVREFVQLQAVRSRILDSNRMSLHNRNQQDLPLVIERKMDGSQLELLPHTDDQEEGDLAASMDQAMDDAIEAEFDPSMEVRFD